MPRETSWHVPTIFSYRVSDAHRDLNVVLLQRMTETERKHVEQALENADEDAVQRLNIPGPPALRPLRVKKWIRDYFPSTANTLTIAKEAYRVRHSSDLSFTQLAFVDSGWDLGNVIVAHWERQDESEEMKLAAARVPVGIVNALLTACDRIEGMTLAHALGADVYQRLKVDFYADLPNEDQSATAVDLPEHHVPFLPQDLTIGTRKPVIISLRHLDDDTVASLSRASAAAAQMRATVMYG